MTEPPIPSPVRMELEFLSEPALIVDLVGRVRKTNSAARDLLGKLPDLPSIFDLVTEQQASVGSFLRTASRSTSPHVGSLTPAQGPHTERFRALAARVANDVEPLVIVRLEKTQNDRFAVLNRRLNEIDEQLHLRLREKAMLAEALSENMELVRELQHRVKNNIQQMLALIKMSASGQSSPEVTAVIGKAADRLQAMALAQEALYRSDGAGPVSAREVVDAVANATASSFGASAALQLSLADASLTPEEAHCLALICNELIANACKHGLVDATRLVKLSLAADADTMSLEVHDDGPGFDPKTRSRGSGLMLVQSLCRQIGGTLSIDVDSGSKFVVRFKPSVVT